MLGESNGDGELENEREERKILSKQEIENMSTKRMKTIMGIPKGAISTLLILSRDREV